MELDCSGENSTELLKDAAKPDSRGRTMQRCVEGAGENGLAVPAASSRWCLPKFFRILECRRAAVRSIGPAPAEAAEL